MEDSELSMQEISSVSNINDFLGHFKDETAVSNCVESITYDIKSQRIIIQMQKLLKEGSEEFASLHNEVEDLADGKIRRLSENYKEKYPELLNNFKKWKPVRENLVKLLRSSSENLDRNFAAVSCFRILTSVADIFGTLVQTGGKSDSSWAGFAMEHASTFGLLSLFLEMTLSKKMHRDVKKAINEDRERFKSISQWFKQTEELDCAIKNFFPYGIDTDITKRIAKSASDFDDYHKIFMSIVASNVKRNVKLFKDRKFLDKADRIATSEAGKQWFHKIMLQNDPYFTHVLNSTLNEQIQISLKNSSADKRDLCVDGWRVLSSEIKLKLLLNVMTIITASSNLLYDNKPEDSDVLRGLSESTQRELEEMRNIVCFLKPSEFELDPVLH